MQTNGHIVLIYSHFLHSVENVLGIIESYSTDTDEMI
jgi:hypothetical protein